MELRLLFFLALFASLTVDAQSTYPKIAGYVGILHPVVTFSSAGTETNFKNYYAVGLPVGINIWKFSALVFQLSLYPRCGLTPTPVK
ncbi:hypothetical protein [Pedobacter sp. JY14-1]|uniref:hypothetical protein n=1 Tax=Pedobacter sp. JY14-1 TaxID=3034151 RepID=UPI0023E342D2|nr:hypothetical protein [Pedobacter sp. JY14-1]